jgi:hypothetical protein
MSLLAKLNDSMGCGICMGLSVGTGSCIILLSSTRAHG